MNLPCTILPVIPPCTIICYCAVLFTGRERNSGPFTHVVLCECSREWPSRLAICSVVRTDGRGLVSTPVN